MPNTLEDHVNYTRREWETKYYQDCIEHILLRSSCSTFVDLGGCVGEVTNILKEKIKSLKYFYIVEPVKENFKFICMLSSRIVFCCSQTIHIGLKLEVPLSTLTFYDIAQ